MNVVMTVAGRFVEVQGTAEGMAFTRGELDKSAGAGRGGHQELMGQQTAILAEPPPRLSGGRRAAPLVLATANPDKVREIAASSGPRSTSNCCPARPTCPTWSRTGRRCSTTPA